MTQAIDTGSDAVRVFGVTLVGVSARTGVKLLFTLALIATVVVVRHGLMLAVRRVLGGDVGDPRRFWVRRAVQVLAAIVLVWGGTGESATTSTRSVAPCSRAIGGSP